MTIDIPVPVQQFVVWAVAHPTLSGGAFLGLALVSDWGLGMVRAVVQRTFALDKVPNILASQLATDEAKAIFGILVAAFIAHASAPDLQNYLFDAVGAAAAIYAVPTWRDVLGKLRDIAVTVLGGKRESQAEAVAVTLAKDLGRTTADVVAQTRATGQAPTKVQVFATPRTGPPGPGVDVAELVQSVASTLPTSSMDVALPNPNPIPPAE